MKTDLKLTGFAKRSLEKKKAILVAARELFFQKGPVKTSMAEIAARASVSQVSIYNYFLDKNKLIEIVVTEHLEKSLAAAEKILDLELPFREKMARFFSLGEKKDLGINDDSLGQFNWQDPKLRQIYNAFVTEKQIPFLLRFIEMGKQEGAIKQELANDAIMAYFMANMSIYQDKDFLRKGTQYISSLTHLFFYGLLGK